MLSSSLMDGLYGCAAWIILLAIHAVHAATLLLNLVHHLFTSLRSGGTRLASPSWSADAARWQGHKIPQTLGIIFVPAARGRFNWRRARYEPWPESHVLEGMQVDLEAMVRWCCKLGVKDLILYDEHGILWRHIDTVRSELQRLPNENHGDDFLVTSERAFSVGNLRVTILHAGDGRQGVARTAAGIAKGVQAGIVAPDEIDVDYLQEKLQTICPEPDLLLVLGGLHLRLRGFPPWHTRLCEIYHDSSLGLLGPPRLRYAAFRRALDAYAGCEQRRGR